MIINYLLLPPQSPVALVSFLNNLIALIASTIAASAAVLFFTPKTVKSSDINVVDPHDLHNALDALVNDTETHEYLGHTARWNRAKTLERLLEKAKRTRSTKTITWIILDPNDNKACEYYSQFGHANRGKGATIITKKDVKIELLTTILICLKYRKEPFIDINLYLNNKISLFRLDITESGILLTKPYSDEPAIMFPNGTFFYRSYKEEFHIAKKQSKVVNLDIEQLEFNPNNCRSMLKELGINHNDLTDVTIESIIKQVNKPVKPY